MSFFLNSYIIATIPNFPTYIYDQYWDNTVLLLHGDGTNGSQNNTFLDSSLNNFTITRNGTPTQGSFSPYGNHLWSNIFNGTTGYLNNYTAGAATATTFGTGNFTIELWLNFNSTAGNQGILDASNQKGLSTSTGQFFLTKNPSNQLTFGAHNNNILLTHNLNPSPSTWYHVAISRNGTSLKMFVNGLEVTSATNSTNFNGSGINIGTCVAVYFNGYISNLRIVKGTAVYTSNFTPPTSPLTSIAGTSLLTCQSNTFTDNSSNNFALTVNGNVSISQYNPFPSASPYYPSVNLGSGYFNGTTDYLSAAPNAGFNFSFETFTAEAWVNFNITGTEQPIVSNRLNTSNGWSLAILGGKFVAVFSGSGVDITGTTTIQPNTWYHVAVAGSAGSYKLFVNGIQEGSTYTGATSLAGGSLGIGWYPGLSFYLNGYISNLRITNETALYTTNFTPPISPVTLTTNGGATPSVLPTSGQVSLLCNFANAGIFDNTKKNNLITIGNASVSASQVKYGSGAITFDGTGDKLTIPSSSNFEFGTGDFTIECWVRCTNLAGGTGQVMQLIDFRSLQIVETRPTLLISNGTFVYYAAGSVRIFSGSISANTWYHVAVSRSSGTTRMFVDGTKVGVDYIDSNSYLISAPAIGGTTGWIAGYDFVGNLDDLRITKGIARYTSNFTPPPRAVPDIPYLGVFALSINTANTGTTSSTQFNLALRPSTSYDFDIDWGDGVVETYTSSNTTGYTHTYSTSGIYTVTVAERSLGGFPRVYYNNTGDRQKLLNVSQFGGNQFGTNWSGAFLGCSNLRLSATDFATARTQNVADFSYAWNGCTSLTGFPLIDTSKGQNFQSTWYNCNKLTSFPAINTLSGTNFLGTWAFCSSLTNFPTIELSGCTDFSGTWAYCSKLTAVPVVNYSNATRLGTNSIGIFEGCAALATVNMPFSATQNVQFFDRAFLYCTNLSSAPLVDYSEGTSFWSTWMGPNKITTFPSNLTLSVGQNFTQAWRDCTLLSAFPDTYDFSLSATNFNYAWYGCTSLRNFPNLSATKATSFQYAWHNCTSLSSFNMSLLLSATTFNQAWRNCARLKSFQLTAPNATNFSYAWTNCSSLTGFNLSAPNATLYYDAWDGCTSLSTFPMFDTSKVTDVRYAWSNCNNLTSFPRLNLSGCTDFTGTWTNCIKLTAVPEIDYSRATRLGSTNQNTGIFEGCTGLSSVFMSISSTRSVQNFDRMFLNCTNLREFPTIDSRNALSFYGICYTSTTSFLTSFPLLTTSNVTNFQYAWSNNDKLTTFPKLSTSNGTLFTQAWYNCKSLTAFPDLDFSKATDLRTAWYGCSSLSSFPFIDTRRLNTNLGGIWANCANLRTFPSLTLSGDGGIYDCWSGCVSLTSFPYQDITGATWLGFRSGSQDGIPYAPTGYGAWGNCRSLITFPLLSTGRVTRFNRTWMDCVSLTAFPLISTGSGTDFTSTWQNCFSLSASEFPTLNMSGMTNGTNCFNGVKLTTTSYSALLTSLSATNINTGVTFHGGNSTFNTPGSAARAFLTRSTALGGRGWTITDGGYEAGT
jgi:hypothetical protein